MRVNKVKVEKFIHDIRTTGAEFWTHERRNTPKTFFSYKARYPIHFGKEAPAVVHTGFLEKKHFRQVQCRVKDKVVDQRLGRLWCNYNDHYCGNIRKCIGKPAYCWVLQRRFDEWRCLSTSWCATPELCCSEKTSFLDPHLGLILQVRQLASVVYKRESE